MATLPHMSESYPFYVMVHGRGQSTPLAIGCETRTDARNAIAEAKRDPQWHDEAYSLVMAARGPDGSVRRKLWWVWHKGAWMANDSPTKRVDERAGIFHPELYGPWRGK